MLNFYHLGLLPHPPGSVLTRHAGLMPVLGHDTRHSLHLDCKGWLLLRYHLLRDGSPYNLSQVSPVLL